MEQSNPSSAPDDIQWTPVPASPSSAPEPTGGKASVPNDIVWSPSVGTEPKKKPSDWHVLKAIARGAVSTFGEMTGDKPEEIAYRNKRLGLDEPSKSTGDKVAEFGGGLLAPSPASVSKLGSVSAARAAFTGDKSKLTAGQRTGSEVIQFIERSIARLPGGDYLRHAIKSQNEQLGNQSEALIARLSQGADTSAAGAGRVIKEELRIAGRQMKAAAAEQYTQVEKLIPPDTKIGVKSTLETLRSLTTPTAGAEKTTEQLINPTIKAIREGLEKDLATAHLDALPYSALKELRTKLGSMIEWGPFSTDTKNGQLKKLYEALTADMNTGASGVSESAAAAVRKANAEYAASKESQKALASVINKAGGPEKVFSALISGTKEGATTITQVLSAMDGPSRQILAASALERMGKATAGVQTAAGDAFSASTFLTNGSRMSPEARQALFGQLPGDYAKNVTQLAANVEGLKAYEKILANPAGTGQAVMWGGEVGAALVALFTGQFHVAAGIAASVAGTAAVSAALTNPLSAKWLAQETAKLVIAMTKGETGMTAGEQKPRQQKLQSPPLQGPIGYDFAREGLLPE